ncbi:MAG: hypothetical protein WCG06_03935, partial [Candidatus Omnitrophota bacterium]
PAELPTLERYIKAQERLADAREAQEVYRRIVDAGQDPRTVLAEQLAIEELHQRHPTMDRSKTQAVLDEFAAQRIEFAQARQRIRAIVQEAVAAEPAKPAESVAAPVLPPPAMPAKPAEPAAVPPPAAVRPAEPAMPAVARPVARGLTEIEKDRLSAAQRDVRRAKADVEKARERTMTSASVTSLFSAEEASTQAMAVHSIVVDRNARPLYMFFSRDAAIKSLAKVIPSSSDGPQPIELFAKSQMTRLVLPTGEMAISSDDPLFKPILLDYYQKKTPRPYAVRVSSNGRMLRAYSGPQDPELVKDLQNRRDPAKDLAGETGVELVDADGRDNGLIVRPHLGIETDLQTGVKTFHDNAPRLEQLLSGFNIMYEMSNGLKFLSFEMDPSLISGVENIILLDPLTGRQKSRIQVGSEYLRLLYLIEGSSRRERMSRQEMWAPKMLDMPFTTEPSVSGAWVPVPAEDLLTQKGYEPGNLKTAQAGLARYVQALKAQQEAVAADVTLPAMVREFRMDILQDMVNEAQRSQIFFYRKNNLVRKVVIEGGVFDIGSRSRQQQEELERTRRLEQSRVLGGVMRMPLSAERVGQLEREWSRLRSGLIEALAKLEPPRFDRADPKGSKQKQQRFNEDRNKLLSDFRSARERIAAELSKTQQEARLESKDPVAIDVNFDAVRTAEEIWNAVRELSAREAKIQDLGRIRSDANADFKTKQWADGRIQAIKDEIESMGLRQTLDFYALEVKSSHRQRVYGPIIKKMTEYAQKQQELKCADRLKTLAEQLKKESDEAGGQGASDAAVRQLQRRSSIAERHEQRQRGQLDKTREK